MLPKVIACLGALLVLGACTTARTTGPLRSAQEELLISTAAERAAEQLAGQIPPNLKIFIDASSVAAQDTPYGVAAITDSLLRHGDFLITDKAKADAVVLVRVGALATNEQSTLVGLPQLPVPFFPVGNIVTIPQVSLYTQSRSQGVAKFAATVYNTKTGKLVTSTRPVWGLANDAQWAVLFVFNWTRSDVPAPDRG